MRRLLALVAALALTTTIFACSDEPETSDNTCRVQRAGATELAPTSAAPPKGEVEPLEAFRTHTMRASSAIGGVTRIRDGIASAFGQCFAEVMLSPILDAFGMPICENVYTGSNRYSYANGTYTFHAEQRGGSPDSPIRVDTAAHTDLRLYLTRDAGASKRGALVTVDVLDVNSYLVNPRVVVGANGKAAVAYDRTGPLVGLLGLGETPPNPLTLPKDTKTLLTSAFELEGTAHADLADCAQGYRSVIDHTIPRTALTQDIKPALVSAVLTAPNVRISAGAWDATYEPSNPGVPTGHVDADVSGIEGVKSARIDFDSTDGATAKLTINVGR